VRLAEILSLSHGRNEPVIVGHQCAHLFGLLPSECAVGGSRDRTWLNSAIPC
jgi:hypothetical protein